MVEFKRIEGTLLVGEPASEHEHYDDDAEDLYSHALFVTDGFAVAFYSGIGGCYPVEDAHIEGTDDDSVYYPHQNETTAEVNVGTSTDDLQVFADDVSLEYAVVDDEVYIRSQNEVTAYGGTYLVTDETLYRIVDSLLFTPESASARDEFLDLNPVEEPLHVENVETGYGRGVTYDRVAEHVENDAPNGALQLREPDSVVRAVLDEL